MSSQGTHSQLGSSWDHEGASKTGADRYAILTTWSRSLVAAGGGGVAAGCKVENLYYYIGLRGGSAAGPFDLKLWGSCF